MRFSSFFTLSSFLSSFSFLSLFDYLSHLHFWECLHFWGRLHFWSCLHFWVIFIFEEISIFEVLLCLRLSAFLRLSQFFRPHKLPPSYPQVAPELFPSCQFVKSTKPLNKLTWAHRRTDRRTGPLMSHADALIKKRGWSTFRYKCSPIKGSKGFTSSYEVTFLTLVVKLHSFTCVVLIKYLFKKKQGVVHK